MEARPANLTTPHEGADRHINEVRETIESVEGRLGGNPGPNADYVVLLDRKEAAAASDPESEDRSSGRSHRRKLVQPPSGAGEAARAPPAPLGEAVTGRAALGP